MMKRKRRAFTLQFKANAVRLVKAGERGIGQIAKELDLTETALCDWAKRDAIDVGAGPPDRGRAPRVPPCHPAGEYEIDGRSSGTAFQETGERSP